MTTSPLSVNPPSFSYACFATFAIALIFTLLLYLQTHLSHLNLTTAIPSYMASPNPPFSVFNESKTHWLASSSLPLAVQTISLPFSNDSIGFQLHSALISKYPSSLSKFSIMPSLLIFLTSLIITDLPDSSDPLTKTSSVSPVFPLHLLLELSLTHRPLSV